MKAQKISMKSNVTLKVILGLLFFSLFVALFRYWDQFVIATTDLHTTLHGMLTMHIDFVSSDPLQYGSLLVALSFAYGVFHAVGPGHGKAVIITYLGTHKESMRKGIFISLAAATLQAIVAIALVSILAITLKFNLEEVQNYGSDVAVVSYVLITLLGTMLIATSIHRLKKLRVSNDSGSHHHHHNEVHDHEHHHDHSHSHTHKNSHDHGSGCSCKHTHVPEENESKWQTLTVIMSMGFRPCSGAIVVLIYAHLVDVYFYGVLATLMVGLGTGLSISIIAITAQYARSWLERFATASNSVGIYSNPSVSHYIRFIGGAFLAVLGWSLYKASTTLATHQHLLS